jgi:hypothetical protein
MKISLQGERHGEEKKYAQRIIRSILFYPPWTAENINEI